MSSPTYLRCLKCGKEGTISIARKDEFRFDIEKQYQEDQWWFTSICGCTKERENG